MNNIQRFLQNIDKEWKHLKKPSGFVADITSKSEAEHELGDVESYFRNRNQIDVIAFNQTTGYMPLPLLWMNNESALYYSQVYLRFFIKNYQDIEYLDYIDMSLSYFKTDFKKLNGVTREQANIAKRIVDIIEQYIIEQEETWDTIYEPMR